MSIRTVSAFAANTDLGKTILSTALCRGATLAFGPSQVSYIKPIQTGFPADSDARFVASFNKDIFTTTLHTYTDPVSPHLAAIIEKRPLTDETFLQTTRSAISSCLTRMDSNKNGLVLVETAGGVHSPSAGGTLQSDVYKSLRLPSILIGDPKLGGISTTLCSYESLRARGFDVPLILMFENTRYLNHEIVRANVDAMVVVVPYPPERPEEGSVGARERDEENLKVYFESIDGLMKEAVESLDRFLNWRLGTTLIQYGHQEWGIGIHVIFYSIRGDAARLVLPASSPLPPPKIAKRPTVPKTRNSKSRHPPTPLPPKKRARLQSAAQNAPQQSKTRRFGREDAIKELLDVLAFENVSADAVKLAKALKDRCETRPAAFITSTALAALCLQAALEHTRYPMNALDDIVRRSTIDKKTFLTELQKVKVLAANAAMNVQRQMLDIYAEFVLRNPGASASHYAEVAAGDNSIAPRQLVKEWSLNSAYFKNVRECLDRDFTKEIEAVAVASMPRVNRKPLPITPTATTPKTNFAAGAKLESERNHCTISASNHVSITTSDSLPSRRISAVSMPNPAAANENPIRIIIESTGSDLEELMEDE
ncbi:hypothetical protein HDU98_009932 [Podochytrium sp. JEL0797]|nr:hypothetical protein HDU98_009932 [Podochytrium sp. JEL0797]